MERKLNGSSVQQPEEY